MSDIIPLTRVDEGTIELLLMACLVARKGKEEGITDGKVRLEAGEAESILKELQMWRLGLIIRAKD